MKNIIQIILFLAVLGYGAKFIVEHSNFVGDKPNQISASEGNVNKPEQPQLTQQQHFERLSHALSKLSPSGKGMSSVDYSNYNDAKESYEAITDPQLIKEKEKFLKKMAAVRVRVEKDLREMEVDAEKSKRVSIASELERGFLKEGHDVYVSVSGELNETLNIKYILVSRPFVYNLKENKDFERMLRTGGFKKVVLTDGYDERWEIRPN